MASLFREWKKDYTKLLNAESKSIRKSLHTGRMPSIRKEHEQILIQYTHNQRQIGDPCDLLYTRIETKHNRSNISTKIRQCSEVNCTSLYTTESI
jgi:predicted site-specific integrase-resolvase